MTRLNTAVVGGGIIGACAAIALARQGHTVAWYAPPEPPRRHDGAQARAYALAPHTVRLLSGLGVWEQVSAKAQPVSCMEIYPDKAASRPLLLLAQEAQMAWLAQILGHADLLLACEAQAQAERGIVRHDAFPVDCSPGGPNVPARLCFETAAPSPSSPTGLHTETFDLVIAADGAQSFMRRRAGILWGLRDYGQKALVMALESTEPHQGIACQWFGPDGILALLPTAFARQVSMVYSVPDQHPHSGERPSAQKLAQEVTALTGHRWGALSPLSALYESHLSMTLVERISLGRMLLLGDSAHTVHPLAGYGLNLAMQDLRAFIASVLQPAHSSGISPVHIPSRLDRLCLQRRGQILKAQWGLDLLWQVVQSEGPGLTKARKWGMQAIGALPFVRQWLIGQATAS